MIVKNSVLLAVLTTALAVSGVIYGTKLLKIRILSMLKEDTMPEEQETIWVNMSPKDLSIEQGWKLSDSLDGTRRHGTGREERKYSSEALDMNSGTKSSARTVPITH